MVCASGPVSHGVSTPGGPVDISSFHLVKSALPADQVLISAQAGTPTADVLREMLAKKLSQVPVLKNNVVLGMFSLRSFASRSLGLANRRRWPSEVPVEDMTEKPSYVQGVDELARVIDELDKHDAVLLGTRQQCDGVLAAMDVLRYLFGVAEPFILLGEIEHSLRALISRSVDTAQLARCVAVANGRSPTREDGTVPGKLNEMTFDHYRRIVCDGDNWAVFQPVFAGDRRLASERLTKIGRLRNIVFHFRRGLSGEERAELAATRDWLFSLVLANG